MYSDRVLDHFQHPRNAGELPAPAITVEISNPACGDILRLSISAEQGRIAAARFKCRGCVASIAAASVLTELIQGKTVPEAARVSASEITAALETLPPESGHAAILAEDALKAAIKKLSG